MELPENEPASLHALLAALDTPADVAARARIVLLRAQGRTRGEIANQCGVSHPHGRRQREQRPVPNDATRHWALSALQPAETIPGRRGRTQNPATVSEASGSITEPHSESSQGVPSPSVRIAKELMSHERARWKLLFGSDSRQALPPHTRRELADGLNEF